jgi:hypothetical protein
MKETRLKLLASILWGILVIFAPFWLLLHS